MASILENVISRAEGTGFCVILGGGWRVFLRIDVAYLAWNHHPEKAFSKEEPVRCSVSSAMPLALPGLVLVPPEAWSKAELFVSSSNCAVLWCGLSQSPCSARQCFKGSRNHFPSQEPGSKLENSVVWFGFHSSLQRTESANLYIHVSINSNRCTFDM